MEMYPPGPLGRPCQRPPLHSRCPGAHSFPYILVDKTRSCRLTEAFGVETSAIHTQHLLASHLCACYHGSCTATNTAPAALRLTGTGAGAGATPHGRILVHATDYDDDSGEMMAFAPRLLVGADGINSVVGVG